MGLLYIALCRTACPLYTTCCHHLLSLPWCVILTHMPLLHAPHLCRQTLTRVRSRANFTFLRLCILCSLRAVLCCCCGRRGRWRLSPTGTATIAAFLPVKLLAACTPSYALRTHRDHLLARTLPVHQRLSAHCWLHHLLLVLLSRQLRLLPCSSSTRFHLHTRHSWRRLPPGE